MDVLRVNGAERVWHCAIAPPNRLPFHPADSDLGLPYLGNGFGLLLSSTFALCFVRCCTVTWIRVIHTPGSVRRITQQL